MFVKRIKFVISIIIPIFVFFLMSQNTFASSYSSAIVDFYTNQQVSSTVNLPWSANPGTNKFWLNNIYINDTSLHGSTYTYVAGRIVSEFRNIGLVSNDTYSQVDFCGFNTLTSPSVTNAPGVPCYGNVTITYSDTSSIVVDYINTFVNWDSVTKTGILYFDFSSALDSSKTVDFIQFRFYAPSQGRDILARTTDWYNTPLFTLFDVRSTVNGYETTPSVSDELLQQQIGQNDVIINQNNQIINNQNQNTEDIINNQNQNTEDIIKSNQNCYQNLLQFTSSNLIPNSYASAGATITNTDNSVHFTSTVSNNTQYSYYYTDEFNSNDKYTISGIAKKIAQTSALRVVYSYSDNGTTWASNTSILNVSSATAGTSRNFSYTFSGHKYYRFGFYNSSNAPVVGTETEYYNVMINKGEKYSEFLPYGTEKCVNVNQEYYDQQRQADDNISNQSANDIDGATNQQTTNLIGTISSFVSALQNINTNGSCELVLPFPVLLGGSQTVNPCNGADKAPTIIAAASSLLLITVFVPLAFILVKMIYNEIRSFTNG